MEGRKASAIAAVATAGLLWGLTVPLSKLALTWLDPAWLTAARFTLAALGLGVAARRRLRDALDLRVAAAGAVGFGAVIMLQNAGVQRTSVSHAAVIVGMVPVFVALVAARSAPARLRNIDWSGYAVALVGIGLVAGGGGDGATPLGDAFVLLSATLSAVFIVVQPRLLDGRDAAAVTAVQFAAGALIALPVAGLGGVPSSPRSETAVGALIGLSVAGTLVPFWLFAYGQARVPVHTAGVFLNLEPVVGAALGWLAFGNTATLSQLAGAGAVLAGIALGSLPSVEDGVALAAREGIERLRGAVRPDLRRLTPHAVSITLGAYEPRTHLRPGQRPPEVPTALRRERPRRLAVCSCPAPHRPAGTPAHARAIHLRQPGGGHPGRHVDDDRRQERTTAHRACPGHPRR